MLHCMVCHVLLIQAAVGMFGYMTDLGTVEEKESLSVEAQGISSLYTRNDTSPRWLDFIYCTVGHDLESLLFSFLDEFLFNFSAEPFFIPKVSVA